MTTLFTSPRCEKRQKLSFDQLLTSRTYSGPAKPAFHKAKLGKPLVHRHSQKRSIVSVDTKQPFPFVIRQIFASNHFGPFSDSLLQRIDQSHANGCRENRRAQ